MEQHFADFEEGNYVAAITALSGRSDLSAREQAILGISLLRTMQLAEAEPHLIRAYKQGDLEAAVEYGNFLRASGKHEQAIEFLLQLIPKLDGELEFKALRWRGAAAFQLGRVEESLADSEQAWHGYIGLGDEEEAAKVAVFLAKIHDTRGNYARAEQLLTGALKALPAAPNPTPRLGALQNLIELYRTVGRIVEAQELLREAKPLLAKAPPYMKTVFGVSEANICRLTGDELRYEEILFEIRGALEAMGDRQLHIWVTRETADLHSRRGEHGLALQVLMNFPDGDRIEKLHPDLIFMHGVLARRRNDLDAAIQYFRLAVEKYKESIDSRNFTRTMLQLAYALHAARKPTEAAQVLRSAIGGLLRLSTQAYLRPEIDELEEVLRFAALEPDLATMLDPILKTFGSLRSEEGDEEQVFLHLRTFGDPRIMRNGLNAALNHAPSLLVLSYLALEPDRTRQEIQLGLFPDRDPVTAGNVVRDAIRNIRGALGKDIIETYGPHNQTRYRINSKVVFSMDYPRLFEQLNQGEVIAALTLYKGDFLPEMEGEWVEEKREAARMAMSLELHKHIEALITAGDARRAILMCNQLLRIDPLDLEVLELRVKLSRQVGTVAEIARYTAELNNARN